MKFSAICTSVDLIQADIKMGERGMKASPMWCGVTFTFLVSSQPIRSLSRLSLAKRPISAISTSSR